MIQRAGNPEQFNPDMLPSSGPGPTKPPPPYTQAQKRKRSGEDLDELYKKLQPAPSPQQFSYLNQFEGQELTITKQLNMAYQEPKSASSPALSTCQPQSSLAPPGIATSGSANNLSTAGQLGATPAPAGAGPALAGPQPLSGRPPSRSKASKSQHGSQPPTPQPQPSPHHAAVTSSSSSATAGACSSAPPISNIASPSLQSGVSSSRPGSVPAPSAPGGMTSVRSPMPASSKTPAAASTQSLVTHTSSQVAAATQRLSHFDGSQQAPAAVTSSKSSLMTNITSTNLANLAKGVEQIQNQMQQNMMHGGPFHNIQLQGQMSDMDAPGPCHRPPSNQPPMTSQSPNSTLPQGHPQAINNTYVNANVSIGQLNIQSGAHPGAANTYNANMQVQQMTNEVQGGPNGPQTMTSMSQQQISHHFSSQHGMPPHGAPVDPMMAQNGPPRGPAPPPPHMQRPFPGQSPQLPGDAMVGSPGFPRSAANPPGNANVQIQAKAPNTIQYLPANPPSSQPAPGPPLSGAPPTSMATAPGLPGPPQPQRKEMSDMMGLPPRFNSPIPGMDGPPRTKYFNPGPPVSGPPMAGPPMGPGDMMGPRMPVSSMGPHPGVPQGHMMQQSMMMPNSMMHQQMGPMQGCMSSPGNGPMDGPMGPMGPPDMMQGQMQMPGMPMHGPGGPMMSGPGPGMRPEPGMMPGPPGFQQFQQQLCAQGRSRHPAMAGPRMPAGMHEHMMGGPHPGMMGPGMGPPDMGAMSPGPRGMMPGMMHGHMGGPGPMGPGPMMGMPNMP